MPKRLSEMTKEELRAWRQEVERKDQQWAKEHPEEYQRQLEAARWAQHSDPPPFPEPET